MAVLDRFSLAGKTALVTGGGTGLGQAIAMALADAGADVAVAGRRSGPIEETRGLIEGKGRRGFAIATDVTDREAVQRMVEQTIAAFGHLDILVNNAGGGGAGRGKEFADLTAADWHEGFDTNVTSAVYCCQAVVPHFLERGGGRVINVVSPSGMRGRRGDFIYGVAKAAMIQFTRAFAMTYARDNIRCNGIAPGAFPHFVDPNGPNNRGDAQAIGRTGTDFEIAPPAVFLASEAADYLNGEIVLIDGGSTSAGVLPAGVVPLAEA